MKLRMVEIKRIDLLYLAVAWTEVWGAGMLVAFYAAKEPLLPFVYVWLGGITFAAMTWILEFAIPYWLEKRRNRLLAGRSGGQSMRGGAVDSFASALKGYDHLESDVTTVEKLFEDRTSGKITPMIGPESSTEGTENTENGKDKGQ